MSTSGDDASRSLKTEQERKYKETSTERNNETSISKQSKKEKVMSVKTS